MCLLHKDYVPEDDQSLEMIQFHLLNSQGHLLLLSFAMSLVEQIPAAKFSQQQRYHLLSVSSNYRMKSVRPLRETSDDLAQEVSIILQHESWDVTLVQKVLHCYRSWVEYAVRGEEVKIEILFP